MEKELKMENLDVEKIIVDLTNELPKHTDSLNSISKNCINIPNEIKGNMINIMLTTPSTLFSLETLGLSPETGAAMQLGLIFGYTIGKYLEIPTNGKT
jgi:hypothetical protein